MIGVPTAQAQFRELNDGDQDRDVYSIGMPDDDDDDDDNDNDEFAELAGLQDAASDLASLWISYALGDPDFFPNFEDGVVDCQMNQPDPGAVTVLTGTFGGTTVRSCTVPAGIPLSFPVLNCFFVNVDTGIPCSTDADCPPFPTFCGDSSTCIEDFPVELKVAICEEFAVDNHCGMEVTLDGEPLYPTASGLPLLRAVSAPTPGFFPFPPGSLDLETIASGHWALIPALSPGAHTLEFSGSGRGPDGVCGSAFSLDVTYLLTVDQDDDDDD